MNKVQNFIENGIGKAATKASKNKYISSLANSFILILPLIMIGSFASLLSGISWESYQTVITNIGVKSILNLIVQFTTNIISVYLVMALTYLFLRKKYPGQATPAAMVALGVFLILTPLASVDGTSYISFSWIGSKGMLLAILTGFIVGRFFEFCFDKGICIKMPKGVPDIINQMYRCLVPAIIVIVCAGILQALIPADQGGISGLIYNALGIPLQGLSGFVVTRIVCDELTQVLWFFGIHGGNITQAITGTLYTAATTENIANYAAGEPLTHMITSGFTAIANSGAYVNLCICVLCLISKKKEFSSFGKMSILPTVFMISEPLRFGLPTVLNFYFLIPIVVAPIVNDVVVCLLMSVGILGYPRATYYQGSPFFFNPIANLGVVQGILSMVILLAIDFAIVYPFFKMYERNGMVVSEEEE